MLKSFSHIMLTILLLMSMSDISKVVLLGYTVMTDSKKAAQFCTCSGCNHNTDQEISEHKSEDDPEMCITVKVSSTHQIPGNELEDSTCCSSSNELIDVSICQCNQDTSPENSIATFNTIDKTALFSTTNFSEYQLNGQSQISYIVHNTLQYFREIFHPPR